MTHAFHPLLDREYELIDYRHCWSEDRVFYVDETGRLCSLPAHWTSVVADDPFVVQSGGRSHFRVADLVQLINTAITTKYNNVSNATVGGKTTGTIGLATSKQN